MASSVDWYYHRPNCMTCAKSQAFLNRRKIGVKEMVWGFWTTVNVSWTVGAVLKKVFPA